MLLNGDQLCLRLRKTGFAILETTTQISRSPDRRRTVAFLEQLVDAVGRPPKLVENWRAECLKLMSQNRRSTRLCRMYEMLMVLTCQIGR